MYMVKKGEGVEKRQPTGLQPVTSSDIQCIIVYIVYNAHMRSAYVRIQCMHYLPHIQCTQLFEHTTMGTVQVYTVVVFEWCVCCMLQSTPPAIPYQALNPHTIQQSLLMYMYVMYLDLLVHTHARTPYKLQAVSTELSDVSSSTPNPV